ncbi:hypothetical protein GCM10022253_12600 [Sphingomonas endophytica]|jgi:hypothetical protein|uniref:Uncharacterized protein n=1 Tax=Sphingomonas endophytica TaxID=869719 RepID=A0A7X0JEB3_9SPHN|nr:hypothetical protein [Sphingomonas endophytica]MBB5725970.1 hypothetical protein [Sphingomonas endophytica]MBB6506048.1 hypothetical protein [Sphingomonas endophytica]
MNNDDVITARAELTRRIAAIEWRAGPSRLAPDIDRIHELARHHHLPAAMDVANQLRLALARGERGVPVHRWLQLLGQAVTVDQAEATRRAA